MHIKEMKLANFKGFSAGLPPLQFNIPNGELGSGLNIFVGENNTGKSTLLEAIDFLRNGTKKPVEVIKNKNNGAEAVVEILFQGDVDSVIDGFSQPNKVAVFKRYVFGEARENIRFSRDTADIKAIKLWSNADGIYQNETGIDGPAKKLFEANFVWADTNPNDEVSFGATTICGNLLKEIASGFTETDDYRIFSESFHQTFNSEDSGLRQVLRGIEEKTQEIFREQFGDAGISFRFDELKIESFFKNTVIDIDDGVNTSMDEKGSGMQRSVALALLQVYAEELTKHPDGNDIKKPFFLFIDEPEICLHPKAQERLLDAILEISRTKQVFLTTHSPYFISTNHLHRVGLFIFKKANNQHSIEVIGGNNRLLPWSPTWGEINFKAYQLPTIEFHNELYGRLQEISTQTQIIGFDGWLEAQGFPKIKQWIKEANGVAGNSVDVTLQTFIRNKIHHPENSTMQTLEYSRDELSQSIQEMIGLIEANNQTAVEDGL
ncbi:MAG: AAA family ATPase [Pseudomonadales bacterium]